MKLFIDGNNYAMKAFSTSGKLKTSTGIPTGVTFTFLRMIKSQLGALKGISEVIVAWDRQPSWREKMLASYKGERREAQAAKEPDNFIQQRDTLRGVLAHIGISQMSAKGYEADDLAGDFCRRNEDVVLVSEDDDWLQLIGPTVSVWQHRAKKLVTLDGFQAYTSCLNPEEFVKMKAIMGDDGDSVPGVDGVGKITALKYLRDTACHRAARFAAVEAWMKDPEGYARSFELVNLRNARVPDECIEVVAGNVDVPAFTADCERLQFNSILKDMTGWLAPFTTLGNS